MIRPTVKCDACDWRLEVESIEVAMEWHNKPCPKCGHTPIIDDYDMAAQEEIMLLEAAGLVSQYDSNSPVMIHIDTAKRG